MSLCISLRQFKAVRIGPLGTRVWLRGCGAASVFRLPVSKCYRNRGDGRDPWGARDPSSGCLPSSLLSEVLHDLGRGNPKDSVLLAGTATVGL